MSANFNKQTEILNSTGRPLNAQNGVSARHAGRALGAQMLPLTCPPPPPGPQRARHLHKVNNHILFNK